MENPQNGTYDRIVLDIKRYIDLRWSAMKLSWVERLSLTGASIVGVVLFLFLLQVGLLFLLGVLTYLLGQWIGSMIVAATVMGGILVILGIAIFLLRTQLFSGIMVRVFAKMFFNKKDERYEDYE